ncbi:MAG: DUF4190 domain-containing protein [Chitinophagales bacterium]|nr:DUF4190 domain-containing protein [Chitinophagales bacterium]
MTRTILSFLWLLWLTTTPIAAQNNPIFKAIHHNKELLYLPEMPSTMPAAFSPTKTEACDIIELNDGKQIMARVVVEEFSVTKYQKCDEPNGRVLIINNNRIKKIRYANGKVSDMATKPKTRPTEDSLANKKPTDDNAQTNDDDEIDDETDENTDKIDTSKAKTDPLGILSLCLGALSFFLLFTPIIIPLLFSIAGLTTGIISLSRIRRFKTKFKGSVLGILGIVFAGLSLFISLFALLIVLLFIL